MSNENRKRSKISVNEAIKRAYYKEKEENERLNAENERLRTVDDSLNGLIAMMVNAGHDKLTLDYLVLMTGKQAMIENTRGK